MVIFTSLSYKTIKHIEFRKDNDKIFYEETSMHKQANIRASLDKGSNKLFSYANFKLLIREYSPWVFLNLSRLFMFGQVYIYNLSLSLVYLAWLLLSFIVPTKLMYVLSTLVLLPLAYFYLIYYYN
jgi:hypothetical protein